MPDLSLHEAAKGTLWIAGLQPERVPFAFRVHYRSSAGERKRSLLEHPGPGGCFRCEHFQLEPAHRSLPQGLALGWRLVNISSEPLRLDSVVLLVESECWRMLQAPGKLRMYQHGYQSWTPSGSVGGASRPRLPLIRSFALMNHYVDSPLWGRRDGLLSSQFIVLKQDDTCQSVLLGFLTQRIGLGEIFYRNQGEPSLQASLDYGGKLLGPDDTLEGEDLFCALGRPDALLEAYADAVAEASKARVPERSPVGWCSWYQYYTRVAHADMVSNTDFLAEHPELGVGFVQLDDGYQPRVGDWLDLNDKFPHGLPALTRHVRERGFQAGIWTAPFFASSGSRLLREHREWFLDPPESAPGYAGRPVATGFNPEWKARTWALDLTHPGVLEWLEHVFCSLVEQGFDYHKIDFLFAGLRHGRRHDPRLSPTQAYRQGLAIIRRAIGDERFLLGCGAPIGPSIGFMDGMRVSQDVKEQWDSSLAGLVGKGCGYPAAKGALRTNMTRWFMHRRWWVNDPDCLLVREHDTKLNRSETETLVSVLGATGGMLFLSDDMPRVSAERLELAAAALPPSRLVGQPSDTMARHFPEDIVVRGEDGMELAVLVNWNDEEVCRPLPPTELAGSWFDHWERRLVTEASLRIQRHAVRALRFVPHRDLPRLVGDDLHLVAQVDGRVSDAFDPQQAVLTLRVRDVARRTGRLWIAVPGNWSLDEAALPHGLRLVERLDGVVILAVETTPAWECALAFQARR